MQKENQLQEEADNLAGFQDQRKIGHVPFGISRKKLQSTKSKLGPLPPKNRI